MFVAPFCLQSVLLYSLAVTASEKMQHLFGLLDPIQEMLWQTLIIVCPTSAVSPLFHGDQKTALQSLVSHTVHITQFN